MWVFYFINNKTINGLIFALFGAFLGYTVKCGSNMDTIFGYIPIIFGIYILLHVYFILFPPIKIALIEEKLLKTGGGKIKLIISNNTSNSIGIVDRKVYFTAYTPIAVGPNKYRLSKFKTSFSLFETSWLINGKDKKEFIFEYLDTDFSSLWFKNIKIKISTGRKISLKIRNINSIVLSFYRYWYEIIKYKYYGDKELIIN